MIEAILLMGLFFMGLLVPAFFEFIKNKTMNTEKLRRKIKSCEEDMQRLKKHLEQIREVVNSGGIDIEQSRKSAEFTSMILLLERHGFTCYHNIDRIYFNSVDRYEIWTKGGYPFAFHAFPEKDCIKVVDEKGVAFNTLYYGTDLLRLLEVTDKMSRMRVLLRDRGFRFENGKWITNRTLYNAKLGCFYRYFVEDLYIDEYNHHVEYIRPSHSDYRIFNTKDLEEFLDGTFL